MKDIIRSGEGISIPGVETAILEHSDVLATEMVAYPDERLGEMARAVLLLQLSASMDLAALPEHLLSSGLSKSYISQLLILREELPWTPSGEIRKFRVPELVADGDG
jgi:non-ribosomal peptide synthetase component E (peptide arylation enzyme)